MRPVTLQHVKHGRIGRYELLHKIAAGGMAEIFLARQWGQGGFFRDVVIKRLFPHSRRNMTSFNSGPRAIPPWRAH